MTFLQLQYFLKACESGNLNTAAAELYLTRSALSKSIRDLEDEFGGKLFERTADGLVPTEMGEALRENSLTIVSLMDRTGELMRSLAGKKRETVHVGVTPATVSTIFPRLYQGFTGCYPEIPLIPVEGGNTAVQNLLATGRIDACFTTYSENFPDGKGKLKITEQMDLWKLYDTELVFCVQRGGPLSEYKKISVESLIRQPIALLKKPMQREAEINYRFLQAGAAPLVIFRTSHVSTLRHLVACGMACTVQLRGTLDDPERIAEIPLDPAAPYANVLIWNRASVKKPGAKAFIDFCKSQNYQNYP